MVTKTPSLNGISEPKKNLKIPNLLQPRDRRSSSKSCHTLWGVKLNESKSKLRGDRWHSSQRSSQQQFFEEPGGWTALVWIRSNRLKINSRAWRNISWRKRLLFSIKTRSLSARSNSITLPKRTMILSLIMILINELLENGISIDLLESNTDLGTFFHQH